MKRTLTLNTALLLAPLAAPHTPDFQLEVRAYSDGRNTGGDQVASLVPVP
jgi:hypothetical protein